MIKLTVDDQGTIVLPKEVLERLRRGTVKVQIDGMISDPTFVLVSLKQYPKALGSGLPGKIRTKAAQSSLGIKSQEPDDSELKLVDGVPVFNVEVEGGDVVEAIRRMRGE